MDNWVWIVAAIVVLLLVIGVIAAVAQRRKQESNRREAAELRERARHLGTRLEREEAEHAELLREADEMDPDVDASTSEQPIVDRPMPDRGIN